MPTLNHKNLRTPVLPGAKPRGKLKEKTAPPQSREADEALRELVRKRHELSRTPFQPDDPQSKCASFPTRSDKQKVGRFRKISDLSAHRPNGRLLALKPPVFWFQNRAVPWIQLGDTLTVAMANPSEAAEVVRVLATNFQKVVPVEASEKQIRALLLKHFHQKMLHQANTSVPEWLSCRTRLFERGPLALCMLTLGLAAALVFAPALIFSVLCCLALLQLLMFSTFKLAGLIAYFKGRNRSAPPSNRLRPLLPLPRITILVPLFQETSVRRPLLARLAKLAYPRDLLEVLLVLEQDDPITQRAVAEVQLPDWVKVIETPKFGSLRTKPRAMNYALNFSSGDIIGVWDAEDAPQPDQLEQVAKAFTDASPRTACFQGVLDYYNPHANWISRCFTLEYASWFRIIMPGIAHLGLVLPLGGTTMFVRRDVLEAIGAWDAHNVTEDADLGVRLFRAGYRTEMLPTTTFEEANCRPWPWIRQRSRWLKGFMLTYLVHMRRPRSLIHQFGWKRFFGFQAFFLGTVGQFLLAPILWSFWLLTFGLPHPSAEVLSPLLLSLAAATLVFFELLGLTVAVIAAFAAQRPSLAFWAPSLIFYYPMGVIAVGKAIYEILTCPFFWDKTTHGLHSPEANLLEEPVDTADVRNQPPRC